jgi:hypothetical protein
MITNIMSWLQIDCKHCWRQERQQNGLLSADCVAATWAIELPVTILLYTRRSFPGASDRQWYRSLIVHVLFTFKWGERGACDRGMLNNTSIALDLRCIPLYCSPIITASRAVYVTRTPGTDHVLFHHLRSCWRRSRGAGTKSAIIVPQSLVNAERLPFRRSY